MDISVLILRVAILFIMMVPGVILKKCRLVPDGFGKGVSNLVLYIAQPVLVLYSYLSFEGSFADIWQGVVAVLILSVIAHVIFAAVSLPLFRGAEHGRRRMLQMATVFSNAAFMGIPLIQVMLGAECAIYASVYNVTYNFFLWTLGVHLCTVREGEDLDGDGDHDKDDRRLSARRAMKKESSVLKVLVHPVTVASVLGILCLVLGVNVSAMEDAGLGIVTQSLDMLAALVAPLSMVVIGLRIPDVSLRGVFRDLNMYLYLALRHLILPLAVVGIMRLSILLGIGIGEEALLVVTVLAAVPSASSATMFAEKYGCDAAYVSRLVIISTLLSIATLPLVTTLATLGL